MVDIQFTAAENRREKKEESITTAAKYDGLPITMGGHKEETTRVKYNVRICYA